MEPSKYIVSMFEEQSRQYSLCCPTTRRQWLTRSGMRGACKDVDMGGGIDVPTVPFLGYWSVKKITRMDTARPASSPAERTSGCDGD